MGEVTTTTVLELLVVSGRVRVKEPVSVEDSTARIADGGQSALQETHEGQSGKEVHGADPARLEEPSKHGPAARREEEPAGRPSGDDGGEVQSRSRVTEKPSDVPSTGDEGGQRRVTEKRDAGADRGERAEDPEPDAQQTDIEDQIKLEAQKQAHRLSPEFPEALYELLCTLQEGRRLNDQRCSFRLKAGVPRRRCQSEPNTTKPTHRVIFSSMTSLQQEEFFDQVAEAQGRRLDDQRSQLQDPQVLPISKAKGRSFRGSLKHFSSLRKPPPPAPVPKEDLYTMILNTQAQGRLEEQRSRAPGPMDDEDFFSLLLKVQGGRMEEQRTEFPQLLLQT
ncbi:G-protein-signaling modulator 1 [Merluccius polli]|uniref:G-protein-signaling modulator 1 n=1 Tax=Merluccius polli TaxID=89951 RepID=A0AA47MBH0_MERPO|nr:G-protein-signaling modulator 1 [Merluccius polli]